MRIEDEQARVCARYATAFVAANPFTKAGVAKDFGGDRRPLNGLRHPPTPGTSGWYLWSGEELSEADDFFEPVHVAHLERLQPSVLPYLGLGPGWRFLIAGDHVDVWFDAKLLDADMTPEDAMARLIEHANPHDPPWGFMDMLRPFRGLRREVLAEVTKLTDLASPLLTAELVPRQLVGALWTIVQIGRLWALDKGGMLERNHLLSDEEREDLERFLDDLQITVDGYLG